MLGDNKKQQQQVTAGISRAETQLLPELTAGARWLTGSTTSTVDY